MKVFLQSIIAQLLLNPYICWRGYQALPSRKSWRIPLISFFIIELVLFFIGFFFWKELPDRVMVKILYVCNSWYVAMIYITMGLLVMELLQISNRWLHWFPLWIEKRQKKIRLILFFLLPATVGALMVYGWYAVADPVVRHVTLTVPKDAPGRDSLVVLMMSDLHIGELIGKQRVQHFVRMANAQQPDMVVLVGDLMDYESRFAEKERIEEDLRQLNAPLGVYAVLGNHEYRANRFAKYRWIEKTGVTLLVDSVVKPDSSFYLIGRDDFIHKGRKTLHTLMETVDGRLPVIVLDHQPQTLTEMAMNRIDIGLHGHTHNGQWWPLPWLLHFVYECPYGYYQKGVTQFFVSAGIGIAGAPYRIGTRSEMVVLHIRFAGEK